MGRVGELCIVAGIWAAALRTLHTISVAPCGADVSLPGGHRHTWQMRTGRGAQRLFL